MGNLSSRDLLQAWPTIIEALAWCELHIFDEFAPEGCQHCLREEMLAAMQKGFTIDEAIKIIQETIQESIDDPEYFGNKNQLARAINQSRTKEFKQYLGSRFGLM